tara:strand:+ start:184 stop:366 length:183 start_codon:yes stop_codon:yes gene_type:complete
MNNKSQIRTSINQAAPHKSNVDVDVLKRRVFLEEKKIRLQNRIIFASAIVSLGVISYLSV